MVFFFFKRTTAYDMRISDWSSDECSSDLNLRGRDRYAIGDVERGCRALEKGGAALARFTQRDRPIAEQGDEHPRKSGPCPYIEPRSVAIGPVEQLRRIDEVALPDPLDRRGRDPVLLGALGPPRLANTPHQFFT